AGAGAIARRPGQGGTRGPPGRPHRCRSSSSRSRLIGRPLERELDAELRDLDEPHVAELVAPEPAGGVGGAVDLVPKPATHEPHVVEDPEEMQVRSAGRARLSVDMREDAGNGLDLADVSGLLLQLPNRGRIGVLAEVDSAAGQGPRADVDLDG